MRNTLFKKLGVVVVLLLFSLSACSGGTATVPQARSIQSFVQQPGQGGGDGGGGGIANCSTTGTCNPNCPGQVDTCTTSSVAVSYGCDSACQEGQSAFGMHVPSIQPDPNNANCIIINGVVRCIKALINSNTTPVVAGVAPGVGAIISALTQAGLPTMQSSAAQAQTAVESLYGADAQQAFSTTAETLEVGSWSSAYNTAFNGTTAPTFESPTTITGNTLISFGSTQSLERNFTTTVDQVIAEDGTVATPAEIQSLLDLPSVPQYATINLSYPPGSQVFIGETAGGEAGFGGAGGAAELFSTEAAVGTESVGITEALEALGALLLLDKNRRPMAHSIAPRYTPPVVSVPHAVPSAGKRPASQLP